MSHFKSDSIEEWVSFASSNDIICALVVVLPSEFPGVSTHYDFISRLWMSSTSSKKKVYKSRPSKKLEKKKLLPKRPGIVKYLVDKALSGQVFKAIPERLYQAIFMKTALVPSINLGLLGDANKLTVSADGTCIISNAATYGRKTCSCDGPCSCLRSFSDPDAKWGWDSYHKQWFFGYTAYLLSVHNKELKLDLPIYMRFVEASRNDSVTLIPSLAHARFLYKDILSIDSLLADAIHDNYPTYDLLKQWNIKPFIPLNNRSDNMLQNQDLILSNDGIPICADGHEMVNWDFEAKKYRIKYRCPLMVGKVGQCPYAENCN